MYIVIRSEQARRIAWHMNMCSSPDIQAAFPASSAHIHMYRLLWSTNTPFIPDLSVRRDQDGADHLPVLFVPSAEELIQSWLTGVEDGRKPPTLHTGSHDSSVHTWAGEGPVTALQRAMEKTHKPHFHKGICMLNMSSVCDSCYYGNGHCYVVPRLFVAKIQSIRWYM